LTFREASHNGKKTGEIAIVKSIQVMKRHRELANDPELLEASRLHEKAFTRKRKGGMGFTEAVSFMLDMSKTTLQARLNRFYHQVKGGTPISQPAFTKLRAQFDHTPFEVMVRDMVEEEYSGKYALPKWKGFHLLAVDGSYLQLPTAEGLAEEFGVRGGSGQPSAGASTLYDVLHGWAIDPIITHTNMNERTQLGNHVRYLCDRLPDIAQSTLLLLDRGYPSQDVFALLAGQGLRFCARCKNDFSKDVRCAPMGSNVVTLKNGLAVRVVKFLLDSGEVETLATDLFDLPEDEFPALYAMRWGIETMYGQLKQKIGVEKFSGKTPNSIRQDFWASMVMLDTAAVFQNEADEMIAARQKTKNNKHFYRARTSDLLVIMRDRFIFATLCGRPVFSKREFNVVMREIARAVSPVRPGRHFPRAPKLFAAANHNLKSCL
jgi:hypothetical protein